VRRRFCFKRSFLVLPVMMGLTLTLSGCRDFLARDIFFAHSEMNMNLAPLCAEMASLGQVSALQSNIHRDMSEIQRLFQTHLANLKSVEQPISDLSHRVQEASARLTALTSSRFSTSVYKSELVWTLDAQALGLAPEEARQKWTLADIKIESGFDWQGENENFKEAVTWNAGPRGAVVKLSQLSAALDICQLQSTLVLYASLTFESRHREQKTEYVILSGHIGDR
jgi:hypothetical protein